nr:hypothetical protein CFP56_24404 [Quercus suber]
MEAVSFANEAMSTMIRKGPMLRRLCLATLQRLDLHLRRCRIMLPAVCSPLLFDNSVRTYDVPGGYTISACAVVCRALAFERITIVVISPPRTLPAQR